MRRRPRATPRNPGEKPNGRTLAPGYSPAVSFTVTCAQCREEVLGADLIGDAEECLLRDHLLAVHPKTVQPDTLTMLLRHFVVSEGRRRPRFVSGAHLMAK